MNDINREKRKRLCRDLWIIWQIQIIAVLAACLSMYLYASNLVPDYPEWDNIHSLCGVGALAGMIIFVVAMLWGSWKYSDVDRIPGWVRVYAASLWIWIPMSLLLAFFSPLTMVACMLIFVLPVYSIVPQFVIFRLLSKNA